MAIHSMRTVVMLNGVDITNYALAVTTNTTPGNISTAAIEFVLCDVTKDDQGRAVLWLGRKEERKCPKRGCTITFPHLHPKAEMPEDPPTQPEPGGIHTG